MSIHDDVFETVVETIEDVLTGGVGSRCVVIPTPSGWGGTYLLDRVASQIEAIDDLATVVRISGDSIVGGLSEQLNGITSAVNEAVGRSHWRATLGLESGNGVVALGLGVADAAGMFGAVALAGVPVGSLAVLAGSLAMSAFSKHPSRRDQNALNQAAVFGQGIADFSSKQFGVVILIDNAHLIDHRILNEIATKASAHETGRTAIVAVVEEAKVSLPSLCRADPYHPRCFIIEPGGAMELEERSQLAAELFPQWPSTARQFLVDHTSCFAELFEVSKQGASQGLESLPDWKPTLSALTKSVARTKPLSPAAALIGWLGGTAQREVFDVAAEVLSATFDEVEPKNRLDPADPNVEVLGSTLRLTKRAMRERAATAAASRFSSSDLRRVTQALIAHTDGANLPADPFERLRVVEPVWIAIRRSGLDLDSAAFALLAELAETQLAYGDVGIAAQVLRTAAELMNDRLTPDCLDRLAVVEATLMSGATTRFKGGGYAGRTAVLVEQFRHEYRPGLLAEAQALVAEFNAISGITLAENQRLAIGTQLLRTGHDAVAHEVLSPLLALEVHDERRVTAQFLFDHGGPTIELVLERQLLVNLLEAAPAVNLALRVELHRGISELSARLGEYQSALDHETASLMLRTDLLGEDHPAVLFARNEVAVWTGECGRSADALRLFRLLLPDQMRVLGRDHPDVLITRLNIASWIGRRGGSEEALALCKQLLPDMVRVLGEDHHDVFAIRINIGVWTGEHGDSEEAVRLLGLLLPDLVRVLGADHPDVLKTRGNIASWTGLHGEVDEALRLSELLLPDQVRVLGTDHPSVLIARNEQAMWTGRCGDSAEALRLLELLLPDQVRLLGEDHPNVLTTRNSIAYWTNEQDEA